MDWNVKINGRDNRKKGAKRASLRTLTERLITMKLPLRGQLARSLSFSTLLLFLSYVGSPSWFSKHVTCTLCPLSVTCHFNIRGPLCHASRYQSLSGSTKTLSYQEPFFSLSKQNGSNR